MFKNYSFRNYDIKLILYILALSIIGIYVVGSANEPDQKKQLFGVIVGMIIMIVISLLDYSFLLKLYWLMYIGNLGLLLMVKFFGDNTKGATRWLDIGGFLRFQPSETAKILLILFFAQFIMKYRKNFNTVYFLTTCIVLMAIPWYLVFKQPDLSTSIVLLVVFAVIMFSGGIHYKIIVGALAVAIPAIIVVISLALQPNSEVFDDYQRGRILAFVDPEAYATTTAYQQLNSVMAIASGMLEGKGYKNNSVTSVKNGNFISEPQNDFIFAVIGEELGFRGCCVIIILMMLISLECVSIARKAKDTAGTIIASSMGGLIAFQSFVNIGVATFIIPNTGVTLPFVSYGLTSLLSLYIGMGFVLNVKLQSKRKTVDRNTVIV